MRTKTKKFRYKRFLKKSMKRKVEAQAFSLPDAIHFKKIDKI